MSAADPYGSGGLVVFDTSAWVRQNSSAGVSARWQATLTDLNLTVCPVVALELLAGSCNEDAFGRLDRALSALPQAPVTRSACDSALSLSRRLKGQRRLPAADYLIAAAAAERGAAVLHYDHHFDPLCAALGIESIWLADPGSLD